MSSEKVNRLGMLREELRLMWQVARRVFGAAWQVSWWRLLLAGSLSILTDVLPFASSFLFAAGLNELTRAVTGQPVNEMVVYGAIIGSVVVTVVLDALRHVRLLMEDNLNELLELDLMMRLNTQYVRLDLAQLEGIEFQQLSAKVGGRYVGVSRRLTFGLFRIMGQVAGLLTATVIIWQINPWFIPLLLLGVLPSAWANTSRGRAFDRFWSRRGLQRRLQFRTTSLFELPKTSVELRLNGITEYLLGRLREFQAAHFEGLAGLRRKYGRLAMAARWCEELLRLGIVLELIHRVLLGRLAIGTFTFYSHALSQFGQSVSGILLEFTSIYEDSLVMRDIYTMFDMQPQVVSPPNGRKLAAGRVPRIEFKNVVFGYPDTAAPVFDGLSLVIEPGETVALVGENGAGKSTLIKLLARLYDVQAGAILIDGVDIREYDLPTWQSHLGVLMQDFNHYPYTARENIELGRINARGKRRRLKQALAQADAERIVAEWPKGLEQPLSKLYEDGVDLSGGQWQRIALARAFFRSAEVLVLDEPTSAVDAQAEAQIFDELMSHQEDKTTIIVSHRFSTVRRAGRIFVFEHGRIIEQGSHQQLMRVKDGTYRRLFELQAEGYR